MAVVYSLEEYRALQQKRISKLQEYKRRGPITSAKFMVAQLRTMCPRGRTSHPSYPHMYQTIKRSKAMVRLSGVNKKTGFPYVHWVNATPGMGMNQVNLFGKGKMWTYAQTNHTGVPGFYWIAQNRAREYGVRSAVTTLRNTLRASF